MTHQMASVAQFSGEIALVAKTHKWNPNRAAELNAIATALGSDTTKHDATMEKAPVQILQPGNAKNTKFTNDILLVVNQGKAGNLTNAQMAAAITGGLAQEIPPVNTVAPVVTGTGTVGQTLTCTPGTWSYAPTFTYQWYRGGTLISGATASTRVLAAADSGASVSCHVIGTNPAGAVSANSNAIAVA